MSNKKYKYGFKKIKREKKIESLIQFDALDKFVTIHKKDIWISTIDEKMIEQLPVNNTENTNSLDFNKEQKDLQENALLEENNEYSNTLSEVPKNIHNPRKWKIID